MVLGVVSSASHNYIDKWENRILHVSSINFNTVIRSDNFLLLVRWLTIIGTNADYCTIEYKFTLQGNTATIMQDNECEKAICELVAIPSRT